MGTEAKVIELANRIAMMEMWNYLAGSMEEKLKVRNLIHNLPNETSTSNRNTANRNEEEVRTGNCCEPFKFQRCDCRRYEQVRIKGVTYSTFSSIRKRIEEEKR